MDPVDVDDRAAVGPPHALRDLDAEHRATLEGLVR
jgi:hypothetical protein